MHLLFPTPGCQVRDLLSDADRSDCDTQDDGLCRCTLLSRSGRYGLMYNRNSPGSIAEYFIDPNYCYKGSESTTRICQASGSWTGEELHENDITDSKYTTLYR